MPEGILIEPLINGKEHGIAVQMEVFSFSLKITNKGKISSQEFNISQIFMRSAEGQSIAENFDNKNFPVEELKPEESKFIEIGKYGPYMYGIVSVSATIQPTNQGITLELLQGNKFTGDITKVGINYWIDFFYVRNLNEYKQERINSTMIGLTIVITIFTLLQILFISVIEPRIVADNINRKINQADNFNLIVACQIKSVLKKQEDKNFLINYHTQIYKDNFDSLNRQSSSTNQAIIENIFLMDASNKIIGLLFEQPQKRSEFTSKLIDNANQIIKNLDVYNEQNIEGECKN